VRGAREAGQGRRTAHAHGAWFLRVVAGVLLIVAVGAGLAWAPSAPAVTEAELQQGYRDSQELLKEAREGRAAAEEAAERAAGDIQAMDQQIEALEILVAAVATEAQNANDHLILTRERLRAVTVELDAARATLEQARRDLEYQQGVLERRVVGAYKHGSVTYLEILFAAEEWRDLLNRVSLVATLLKQDQDTVADIERLRDRVVAEEAALDQERAHTQELEQRQATEAEELDCLLAEREQAVAEAAAARNQKQVVLDRAQRDAAAYEAQEAELEAQSEKITQQLRGAGVKAPSSEATGSLVWPMEGDVSSSFGMRTLLGITRMHNGIDIAGPTGRVIVAADGGTVALAGWNGGYGKCVIVDHGGGMATLYAHQSQINVSVGQEVGQGDTLGLCGSTGYSTGPHLHFEVRVNGSPVNPLNYL